MSFYGLVIVPIIFHLFSVCFNGLLFKTSYYMFYPHYISLKYLSYSSYKIIFFFFLQTSYKIID